MISFSLVGSLIVMMDSIPSPQNWLKFAFAPSEKLTRQMLASLGLNESAGTSGACSMQWATPLSPMLIQLIDLGLRRRVDDLLDERAQAPRGERSHAVRAHVEG